MGRKRKDMTAESVAELEKAVADFRTECEAAVESIRKAGEVYAQKRSEILKTTNTNQEDASFDDERLISPDEAAEFVGKTKKYLYQLVHRKEIPYVKRGGSLFFRKKSLRDWCLGKVGKPIVE